MKKEIKEKKGICAWCARKAILVDGYYCSECLPHPPTKEKIIEILRKHEIASTDILGEGLSKKQIEGAIEVDYEYADQILELVKEEKEELLKEIEKIKKRFKCAACDGARCEHTQCCQALEALTQRIKNK